LHFQGAGRSIEANSLPAKHGLMMSKPSASRRGRLW